jgi:hypothetical protein
LHETNHMQIINPIYDSAFKYLMDNNQVAKLILSAIIGEEVEELLLDATELKVDVPKDKLENLQVQTSFFTILRIDFAARVKTADGKHKEVLIEIQKAKLATDITRFRRYLGERYANENVGIEIDGQKKSLPLLPIYFLGHPLDNCDATVLKVNRQYLDVITGKTIEAKEDFIESLTHDCFVIQIAKLKHRRRNDLEALLSIFDQENISGDRHILNVKEEDMPEKYRPVLRRLLEAISEKKVREGMKAEDEVLNELQALERIIELERKETEKERKEKLEAQERERKAQEGERKAQQREMEAKKSEMEAWQAISKIVKQLHGKGFSIAEISTLTGRSEEEIESILK